MQVVYRKFCKVCGWSGDERPLSFIGAKYLLENGVVPLAEDTDGVEKLVFEDDKVLCITCIPP